MAATQTKNKGRRKNKKFATRRRRTARLSSPSPHQLTKRRKVRVRVLSEMQWSLKSIKRRLKKRSLLKSSHNRGKLRAKAHSSHSRKKSTTGLPALPPVMTKRTRRSKTASSYSKSTLLRRRTFRRKKVKRLSPQKPKVKRSQLKELRQTRMSYSPKSKHYFGTSSTASAN